MNPVVKHWVHEVDTINAPLARNNMFKPSNTDGSINTWTKKGLVTLKNLNVDDKFAPFEQLRLKMKIPNSHYFKYLQLCSVIPLYSAHFPPLKPSSLLEPILELSFTPNNSYNSEPLTPLKRQWEEE